tara:strand:+ start:318 stop:1040 length:723 start_codon:yes stop_codon:yes gene_type:complete
MEQRKHIVPCVFKPTKEEKRQIEKRKYDFLYSEAYENKHGCYGGHNHGQGIYDLIKQLGISSILDVGCGQNNFTKWCRENNIRSMGVDISSPKADIVAPAHNIPVEDKSFDYITCFDVMEHLLEEEIDEALKEFTRIARRGLLFCISYEPSKRGVVFRTIKRESSGKLLIKAPIFHNNKCSTRAIQKELRKGNLHQAVKPQDWWIEKIKEYGETNAVIRDWYNSACDLLEHKNYIHTVLN